MHTYIQRESERGGGERESERYIHTYIPKSSGGVAAQWRERRDGAGGKQRHHRPTRRPARRAPGETAPLGRPGCGQQLKRAAFGAARRRAEVEHLQMCIQRKVGDWVRSRRVRRVSYTTSLEHETEMELP